ncbi:hypothetical protein DPMN_009462 [Dreissena polymorpha]|uniref:Uncharacterized protein n=1 Tax=Dreissena polymorpha TaxID=45954 RepID=A0A9D4MX12_DREPO|nr:hypothetical protein DPMN_009462 [Dreissena polymorpha]
MSLVRSEDPEDGIGTSQQTGTDTNVTSLTQQTTLILISTSLVRPSRRHLYYYLHHWIVPANDTGTDTNVTGTSQQTTLVLIPKSLTRPRRRYWS